MGRSHDCEVAAVEGGDLAELESLRRGRSAILGRSLSTSWGVRAFARSEQFPVMARSESQPPVTVRRSARDQAPERVG